MRNLPIPKVLPTLQSDRLTLRMMNDDDANDLFEIYGDPCVMRYTGETPFPDLKAVEVMLASVRQLLSEGSSLEWLIVLKSTQAVIGTCGIYNFNPVLQSAEVGCLLKRKSWGLGYMTEALSLIAAFAAQKLTLQLLLADVAPPNARANRLFYRLGYIQTEMGYLATRLDSGRN